MKKHTCFSKIEKETLDAIKIKRSLSPQCSHRPVFIAGTCFSF